MLSSQSSTLSKAEHGSKAEQGLAQDRQVTGPRPAHDTRINGETPLAPEELHPVIQEFQRVIEEDPILYLGFHQMFDQVPHEPLYDKDPNGDPQVCV